MISTISDYLKLHIQNFYIRKFNFSSRRIIHEVNVNEFIDQNMEDIKNIAAMIDPTDIRDVKQSLTPLVSPQKIPKYLLKLLSIYCIHHLILNFA